MFSRNICIVLTAIAILFANVAMAAWQNTDKVAVELTAEEKAESIKVRLKIVPQNGWYIYSNQPTEFGLPTAVDWGNLKPISEKWSMGEDIVKDGMALNVYKNPAFYEAEIAKNNNLDAKLKLSWLACSDECVPEELELSLDHQAFFAPPMIIEETTSKALSKSSPIAESTADQISLFHIVIIAMLGGMILNFMPCVFPILFLKIISLVQQRDVRKDRIEAVLYMLGVLLCFILMAAVLSFLRSQGEYIGWGFQLQSPIFVIFMAIVFVALGLLFLDVIKFNSALRLNPSNAFFTGFLAVLIASPCTAPFMGAALGWALTTEHPASVYYIVFIALGFGYGLPFFLAGIFPKAIKKVLPKPGVWMVKLKKIFAIPMFLTAIWLIWILKGGDINTNISWQNYDETKIESALNNGQKVLIDFTAKWCITCILNEQTALSGNEFKNAINKNEVALFKADWSGHNPDITKALSKYGRGGVPLYVYYYTRDKYIILPQLLSLQKVVELLNNPTTEE